MQTRQCSLLTQGIALLLCASCSQPGPSTASPSTPQTDKTTAAQTANAPTQQAWERWLADNLDNADLMPLLDQFEALEYGGRKERMEKICYYVAKRCVQARRPIGPEAIRTELRWMRLRNAVADMRTNNIRATGKTCARVQLAKVLDGCTIQVAMPDGKSEQVRLVCLTESSSAYAVATLQDILSVRKDTQLEFDDAFPARDANGRLLAWVWDGPYLANQEMVRRGATTATQDNGRGRHGANLKLLD